MCDKMVDVIQLKPFYVFSLDDRTAKIQIKLSKY